jgi:hypothetical protein
VYYCSLHLIATVDTYNEHSTPLNYHCLLSAVLRPPAAATDIISDESMNLCMLIIQLLIVNIISRA